MFIDVHAHLLEIDLLKSLGRSPGNIFKVEEKSGRYFTPGYGELDPLLYDLAGRLENLERRNVTLQLVASPPPLWSRPGWAPSVDDARMLNDATRRAVSASSGRLGGLVVLPLGEPKAALDELRRQLGTGAFKGVALPTSAKGIPLDEYGLEPLFRYLSEFQIFIFMHSVSAETRSSLSKYTLNTVVGWPTETTIAIGRLIFSGVLERHPLNLVLSHGGGTLPFLAGRMDLAYNAPKHESNPDCRKHISRPPSHYLQELHFDTVVASPKSLSLVVDFAGPERVIFGSDFPYEIGDANGLHVGPAIDALPDVIRGAVRSKNAQRMLAKMNLSAA